MPSLQASFAEVIRRLEARKQAALIAGTVLRAGQLAQLIAELRAELERK